jgi:hypothetical protein
MQKGMLNTVSVPEHISWIVGCRAAKRVALVAALVAFCVVSGGLAHAGAVYSWTKTMGGAGNDGGYSAAVDGSGNVYVAGYFAGTADFDPGPGDSHTSAGSADIFLTKINADGTYGWTKTMGGTSSDGSHSAAVDGSGNVYVTGWFEGTADFDPGPDTDSHTSAGSADIFLIKFTMESASTAGGDSGGGCFIATVGSGVD